MAIRGYPPDGSSIIIAAGEGVYITFSNNTYTIAATGGNTEATYITYDDETSTFPNSARLAAGNNVSFDNTGGVFTINAAATGGGAPTTLSYVTTNSEAALSGERVLTPAYGVSITDNTTTVDVGLSSTFLALPFVTIGNQAGLTGERALAVSTGLALNDAGANSSVTLSNTASSFGRVLVDGATSVNAYLLQDQFGLSAGSNIVLSVNGSTIEISATDSGDANQNAFGTVAISGQNSLISDDPEDTLNIASGQGITLTTDDGTDTLTITNAASAFNTIQVSGQSDVVADALYDTLTFVAGSNVTITTSGDSITISATDTTNPDQNLFETISVAGQSDIVADSTTDTLTFASGDGIEITTNPSTDTLTITNTASSFNQIVVSGQSDIIASQILNSFEVEAGTGITLTTSGSTLNITNSSPNVVQNVFTTFAVSGQNDVIADSSTDTLTLVAGEGVDITTDDSADSITLSNSSSGFNQILVSGQGDVVATELHNSLELIAGTNVTLTTSGTSITFNATGGGDAPADAEYVLMSANGTLTDERVLAVGEGLDLDDGGAGNNATLSNTASSFGKVVVVGESDIDAHYLQDQFALEAGSNVTLSVSGSTINISSVGASGGGGGAPTDVPYLTLATDGTLTDERVFTVGEGLSDNDAGAGNTYTVSNAASSFGKIEVAGQNDVVAHLLQDQFALAEGSNVTITTSGSTITIASTDTTNPDQNLFETISVSDQSDIVADTTNDTLTLTHGPGLEIETTPASDTITFSNTASSFKQIVVSGENDVVATTLDSSFELVAGTNITLSTSGTSITIDATDTGEANQNAYSFIAPTGFGTLIAGSPTSTLAVNGSGGITVGTNDNALTISGSGLQPLDSDLTALAALSGTGMLSRTGAATYAERSITAGAGISVSDGDGVSGNPTITNTASSFNIIQVSGQSDVVADAVQDTLTFVAGSNMTITTSGNSITFDSTDTGENNQNAFSHVATTGWPTASAGSPTSTLSINGSGGISVGINSSTNTVTVSGSGLQPLDATLTSLAAYDTNGILVQTTADTFVGRSIASGTGISVNNGDGVSGNPTINATDIYNRFQTIRVPGWSDVTAGSTTSTLHVQGSGGISVGTSPGSNVLVISGSGISGGGTASKNIAGGRLSLTSATPITTSDVTAAGTLYYTEHTSNEISLYNGSSWEVITFNNISISLTGISNGTNYDVFVYNNSGTATLELTAWTNDTTRATALTRQDGIWVRSGAATRRYVGTIRASANNQCEDSNARRFVYNQYNKVKRKLRSLISTDSWSYASTTYRAWNADTNYGSTRFGLVMGLNESLLCVEAGLQVGYDSVGSGIGIGIDSTSVNSADQFDRTIYYYDPGGYNKAYLKTYTGIGFHYIQALETAGNSHTAYGDNGVAYIQSGMLGEVLM